MKLRITSRFGSIDSMHKTPHTGIDIALPENTPLKSITGGIVEKITNYGSENIGTGILIKADTGDTIIYGHLNKVEVKVGDRVELGELIGYSGNTGRSSGPHLHLGVHDGNKFVDGSDYVTIFESVSNNEIVSKGIDNDITRAYLSKPTQDTINNWLEYLENFSKAVSERGLNFINLGSSKFLDNIFDIFI